MKVRFIGLGRMGAGMAANLLKADHEVSDASPKMMHVSSIDEYSVFSAMKCKSLLTLQRDRKKKILDNASLLMNLSALRSM